MTDPEPAYFIRPPGRAVQGPFPLSRIRRYVAEGRVRPEMDFSRDGTTWWSGADWVELFPPATEPAPLPVAPPAPAPSPPPPSPPVAAAPPAPVPAPRPGAAPRASSRERASGPRRRVRAGARRPPKSPGPAIALVLVVIACGVGIFLWASVGNEQEEAIENLIDLLEEANTLMERMVAGTASPEEEIRFVEIALEVKKLESEWADLRGGMTDLELRARYEERLVELTESLRRNSARLRGAGG